MRWGIRSRLLFATLFPAGMLTLVMFLMLAGAHLSHLRSTLQGDVRALATDLAGQASKALAEEEPRIARSITETAVRRPAINSARITDWRGHIVARTDAPEPHGALAALGRFLLATGTSVPQPLLGTRIELHNTSRDHASVAAPTPSLGTLQLWLSPTHAARRYVALLLPSLLFCVGLLVVGFLLAVAMASSVTAPLRRLVHHARRLEHGDLDERVRTSSPGELGELERGMNSMATAMKERRRQLQQQVRETTSELRQTLQAVEVQNVELDVARKRALEASKVKSEFLANVSHEIRTPINGIVGFADLLHHSALDAEQRDYVNTIKESCANLLAIVNDILDFSKIEAGKLVIDNVAFDLRDSVEEVLSLLAPAAYGKSLELSQLIYADVPVKLYGDPIRVRQVLTNLVHNAIKFTPAGRIVVRVMLEEDGDAQCVVRLTVTDTGIGLSKEDQSKLFQAFSQADTSLTRRFGGTGLGLIISKKLLEQMGGTIGMESERGKGATFWFTLRAQKQRNVDRRDSADWLNPLSGKRMLLFDDEPLSLLSLKHLLESWHIEVTPCDSRRNLESLASADRQWDAIVLGLTRSQLGESEFKGLIPQLHRVGVPLLVMASTVDRNELRLLYQRGAAACLPKAVRRQTVFRELCRLVAPDSAAATGQPHGPSSISRPGAIRREKTVLVVDDNDINRKLVTKIALRHGARLVEAADGSEAVDACRQQRFDVIFMDIHMPGMGGEAATREIRRICKGPAGPRIIALTANAMAGERNRLLNAGMDGCLIKPITEKDVVNALFGGTAQPDQSGSDDASTGDRGAVRDELREMLLAELPQHRDSILQAFREEGHEALRLAVHKLHGAVSVCDLPDLKAACQVLEDAALNGDSDVIPEAIEELLKQLRSFSGTDDSGSSSGKRTTA